MAVMRDSLINAEIRRATAKAAWYESRGDMQQALLYHDYARRLQADQHKTEGN